MLRRCTGCHTPKTNNLYPLNFILAISVTLILSISVAAQVHRVLRPGGKFFATTFLWGLSDDVVGLGINLSGPGRRCAYRGTEFLGRLWARLPTPSIASCCPNARLAS